MKPDVRQSSRYEYIAEMLKPNYVLKASRIEIRSTYIFFATRIENFKHQMQNLLFLARATLNLQNSFPRLIKIFKFPP